MSAAHPLPGLTAQHRRVLSILADDGSIENPDRATAALLDDLVEAGLAVERAPGPASRLARGSFKPTRAGRSVAARFA
jgi:hypothetical protein